MRYLSVCSGIEAASTAWEPLGFTPVAFSEIEPFACAYLAHRYPNVPNFGDMTKFKEWPDATIDLLVGGTPCQAFSIAGLRKGLTDPRGNLALTFLAILKRYRPEWVVWENVPGVLSSWSGADETGELHEGQDSWADIETSDFGSFLAGLAFLGYGFAYRVLDAQFFGVAQRRERVFLVGHARDWRRAAAVLFERESLSGDPPPRRGEGERVTGTVEARATAGGAGWGTDFLAGGGLAEVNPTPAVANPLTARMTKGVNSTLDEGQTVVAALASHGQRNRIDETYAIQECAAVSPPLRAGGNETGGHRPPGTDVDTVETLVPLVFESRYFTRDNKTGGALADTTTLKRDAKAGDSTPLVFDTTHVTSRANRARVEPGRPCHPLATGAHAPAIAVGFAEVADPIAANQQRTYTREGTNNFRVSNVAQTAAAVRRLTPTECMRLQGFPDSCLEMIYASATEAHSTQVLHVLWQEAGTAAREGWRPGIAASLLTPEILLAGVYGGWLPWSLAAECASARRALPGAEPWTQGFVRALQINAERRPSPYRRESFEQLAIELGRPLPTLPLETPQARSLLLNSGLWPEASAEWPLRYAFSTAAKERHKLNPDGPRYRALGNSMAVPCMRWIGLRLLLVEELCKD
jgi:DNA (cytosine-5)-methyltransferase 1